MTVLSDTTINDEDLIEYARQSLTKPPDFGSWGPSDMFESWGFAGIDTNRDSDIVDRSNYRVFHQVTVSQYPDDFRSEQYDHWAVGSVERTTVKVLKNSDGGIEIDNITDAFIKTCEVLEALMDYPILDEGDYSDLEYTEIMQDIEESAPDMISKDEFDWSGRLYEELAYIGVEICPDADIYPMHKDMKEAAYRLGFFSKDHKSEWIEYCTEAGLSIPDLFRKNGVQIEGQQALEVD